MSEIKRFTVMLLAIVMFGAACVFFGYAFGSVTNDVSNEIVEAAMPTPTLTVFINEELCAAEIVTSTPVPTSLPTSTPIPPTSTPAPKN